MPPSVPPTAEGSPRPRHPSLKSPSPKHPPAKSPTKSPAKSSTKSPAKSSTKSPAKGAAGCRHSFGEPSDTSAPVEPVGLGPVAGAPSAGQELPAVGDGDEEAGVTHAVAHTALAAQEATRANVTAALSDAQVAAIEYGRLHPEAEAAAAEFASTHPPVRRTSSVLFPAALLVPHPPPPRPPPTPPPPDDGKENKRLGASAVHQVVPVLSREKAAVYVRQSLGLHWDVYARHRRPHQPPPANRPDSPACDGGGGGERAGVPTAA